MAGVEAVMGVAKDTTVYVADVPESLTCSVVNCCLHGLVVRNAIVLAEMSPPAMLLVLDDETGRGIPERRIVRMLTFDSLVSRLDIRASRGVEALTLKSGELQRQTVMVVGGVNPSGDHLDAGGIPYGVVVS